ncbi:MAG: hypothetical protein ACXWXR_08945 [Candidatus Limnocylindrales bacterium]
MSLPRLWAFLAVALPTLGALIASLQSVDLAYQLRAGAGILDARAIPSVDTWTFTAAGLPWTDQQWGAQVILAAVYRLGGWTGLVLLRAALVAVIFGCLFEVGRRRGLGLRRAAWLTLAAFVVAVAALALRPQLIGMALFAVVLLLVDDRRAHRGRIWLVPAIVIVWANVHGSFFLGPLVLGLAWLGDVHDRIERPHLTLAAAVIVAAAACVTPFGPAVWAYAVGLSTNPQVTRQITEWQPTTLGDVTGLLFYGSALGVAALVVRRGRRLPWPTLLWLAVFFVIGVYAARGVAWWSLAAPVAVAGLVGSRLGDGVPRPEPAGTRLIRRLNLGLAATLVLAGLAVLPVWRDADPATGAPQGVLSNAPPGITAALHRLARPGDRLLNPQPWGSWFEFAVPDLPVALDSRIELIPASAWDAAAAIEAGSDGWEAHLAAWKATIAVVRADDPGLATRLVTAGWSKAFSDPDGSVFLAPGR